MNKIPTAVVVLLGSCFSLVIPAQRHEGNFLDLTRDIPPQRQRGLMRGTFNGGVFASHGPPQVQITPVKVTLLSLSKLNYRMGDDVMFDVEVENNLTHDLVLPWSLDFDRVKPSEDADPPDYTNASVSLRVDAPWVENALVFGKAIYGSRLVPRSLKKLGPGEKVRIRASSPFYFASADVAARVEKQLPVSVDMRGYLWLREASSSSGYQPAVSGNRIRIEIRKQE